MFQLQCHVYTPVCIYVCVWVLQSSSGHITSLYICVCVWVLQSSSGHITVCIYVCVWVLHSSSGHICSALRILIAGKQVANWNVYTHVVMQLKCR